MNQCVCDICCNKVAVHKFKIKKKMEVVRGEFHVLRWVKLDICDSCYQKLMNLNIERDLESRILEFVCEDEHLKRYDDVDLQSAYLDGFQAVLNLMIQNKIIKN